MNRLIHEKSLVWICMAAGALSLAGCTSWSDYIHNGFKVGPNYCPPPAPVAQHWIDENDKRIRTDGEGLNRWWTVFNDPVLDNLIECAYRQNLTLREAGFRVLQARALRGIAGGELFPQSQTCSGSYSRNGLSQQVANRIETLDRWFDQWSFGFGLGWELDFWGRFRRAVEAADAELDASVAGYDDVLVTLLADVGTNYVEIRTLEKRIELAKNLTVLFEKTLGIAEAYYKAGGKSRFSCDLATANLAQAQALVPQLEASQRQAMNRLCILMGMPPRDLQQELDKGQVPKPPQDSREEFNMWPIPRPSREVVAGIPADLLRRRPDVRRAERLAAAQCQRIGIAQSDFYPQISLTGTLGWSSKEFRDLFSQDALRGSIGPDFRWNILNYGRIANNVRFQDARFQELATQYQGTVLKAAGEAEDALVSFLKSQEQAKALCLSAKSYSDGTKLMYARYVAGEIDFLFVAYPAQNLLEQQDKATQAQGDIPLALIDVYRALGGGWQMRLEHETPVVEPGDADIVLPITDENPPPEVIPAPSP
jgi:NodT family efflux transporter outer membrane factor (OMF) lipoprotein